MRGPRADKVATFAIIKGSLIQETYSAFSCWDHDQPRQANLRRLKEKNQMGLSSASWLNNVAKAINRRFAPEVRDRPLVRLAQSGFDIEKWKPLMLWHMTRDEFLLRDFLIAWLFPLYEEGAYRLRTADVYPYLRTLPEKGIMEGSNWSEHTFKRVATGLFRAAVDFGLMTGKTSHTFLSYHLPEESFLYLLHAMAEEEPDAHKLVRSQEWRMYFMTPEKVEQELFTLHQYRKVEYEVAGTLATLKLPHGSLEEYTENLVHERLD